MSEWNVVEVSVPRVSLRGGGFAKLVKNFVLCYCFYFLFNSPVCVVGRIG